MRALSLPTPGLHQQPVLIAKHGTQSTKSLWKSVLKAFRSCSKTEKNTEQHLELKNPFMPHTNWKEHGVGVQTRLQTLQAATCLLNHGNTVIAPK